jgi:hypothetical protein
MQQIRHCWDRPDSSKNEYSKSLSALGGNAERARLHIPLRSVFLQSNSSWDPASIAVTPYHTRLLKNPRALFRPKSPKSPTRKAGGSGLRVRAHSHVHGYTGVIEQKESGRISLRGAAGTNEANSIRRAIWPDKSALVLISSSRACEELKTQSGWEVDFDFAKFRRRRTLCSEDIPIELNGLHRASAELLSGSACNKNRRKFGHVGAQAARTTFCHK